MLYLVLNLSEGEMVCRGESTLTVGRRGERIALSFLKGLGFQLLAQNWKCGRYEIDLIMVEYPIKWGEPLLRVIEVKSLMEPHGQEPFEAVTLDKQRRIINAAAGFIRVKKIEWETLFDVVSISFGPGGSYRVDYFPEAFTPQW